LQKDIREIIRKHLKRNGSGRCLFATDSGIQCSNRAISSHTLQKSDTIRHIVEGGHVLSLSLENVLGNTPATLSFKRIGKSKASVFPGFCAKHDTSVFLEIENGSSITTKRKAALICYRVICLEYFKKEENISLFSSPEIRRAAKSNGFLNEFDAFLYGTKLGLEDLKRSKIEYEAAIHGDSFQRFHATIINLESELPFCFASPFAPEFTFDGKLLLPAPEKPWSTVAAFAGSLAGGSVFMIGGFESSTHNVREFIDSLQHVPAKSMGGVALNLALEYSENTFFRESWIESLDESVRKEMILQFRRGTPGSPSLTKQFLLSLPDRVSIGQSALIDLG